jgi:hypothetical protein
MLHGLGDIIAQFFQITDLEMQVVITWPSV